VRASGSFTQKTGISGFSLAAPSAWKLRAYWLFLRCCGLLASSRSSPLRVRQVEHHQPVGLSVVSHGERPGDQAAPVVADQDGLVAFEVFEHRLDILDQFVQGIVLDSPGLVALVVAALVDGHGLEVLRQGGQLLTPGVPVVGEH
jgi:hypothetical protein